MIGTYAQNQYRHFKKRFRSRLNVPIVKRQYLEILNMVISSKFKEIKIKDKKVTIKKHIKFFAISYMGLEFIGVFDSKRSRLVTVLTKDMMLYKKEIKSYDSYWNTD